jgi:hypothetical protein
MLVGGIVVEDGMDDLAGRHGAFHGVEKANELAVTVLGHAAAEHRPVEDVERGEQRGRAVALVVMGHGPAFAGLERQTGLGAVERLDLGFLIDRQHHGMRRRVQVETDDVLDLLGESRIGGALEGPQTVRLEAMRRPNALHRTEADAGGLGHRSPGPMDRHARRLGAGCREHPRDGGLGQRCHARASGLVAEKAVYPGFGEAPLPAPHRGAAHPGAPRHFGGGKPLGRIKDNACPFDMFARTVAVGDHRGKPRPLFAGDDHTEFLSHAPTMAYLDPDVNLLIESVH